MQKKFFDRGKRVCYNEHMRIYSDNGSLCLQIGEKMTISGITAFAEYPGAHHNMLKTQSGRWEIESAGPEYARVSDGVFSLEFFAEASNTVLVRGAFRAKMHEVPLERFCPFKGRIDRRFERAYVNGYTEFNGIKLDEMQAPVGVSGLLRNEHRESTDFIVGISGRDAVVAGAAEYKENYAAAELAENGELILSVPLYGGMSAEGGIVSDRFVIAEFAGLQSALEGYVALVRKYNGNGSDAGRSHSGWCSWYYYGSGISEEIILENVAELKRRRLPVEYVQIDDGWSVSKGEWEANEKFPHGMKWLADKIREAGFLPGIWVAPLTADDSSRFLKEHGELFVKERDGEGIFGWNSLDLSRKEAAEYLYALFHKLSREWGFRYIKFDFAAYGFSAGRYSSPSYNGMKNYRRALEIMRAAVTEDTVLLACTAPLLPNVGMIQGVRISMDIFERWESLKQIAKPVLLRNYLNGGIRVDPDCLMLRTAENEDGDCFRRCTRTYEEIQTFVALIGVTGGTVMLSDKLRRLTDGQTDLFRVLLPVNQRAGIPVDAETSAIPSVVDGGERGGIRTVVFFNWEDFPDDISFDLGGEYGVFDFWDKKFLGTASRLSETIPPHESRVYQCSPVGGVLAGAYDRLLPEIALSAEGGAITLKELKPGERIAFRLSRTPEACVGCRAERLENGLYLVIADGGGAEIR